MGAAASECFRQTRRIGCWRRSSVWARFGPAFGYFFQRCGDTTGAHPREMLTETTLNDIVVTMNLGDNQLLRTRRSTCKEVLSFGLEILERRRGRLAAAAGAAATTQQDHRQSRPPPVATATNQPHTTTATATAMTTTNKSPAPENAFQNSLRQLRRRPYPSTHPHVRQQQLVFHSPTRYLRTRNHRRRCFLHRRHFYASRACRRNLVAAE